MKRKPIIGPEFDSHQMNQAETVQAYVDTLRFYRPRDFSKLALEGEKIRRMFDRDDEDAGQFASEWQDDCDNLLTDWARRIARHDYISFGMFPHSGDVGFYIYTEGAIEDARAKVNDLSEIPRGFSGLAVCVNDHGNVSAYNFSRGRLTRELFAVV